MLEYDRIYGSEGIDVNKINNFCECIICLCWYFHEVNFRFQPKICNGCHDLIQKAMTFNEVAIFSVKGSNYRNQFRNIGKDEAIYNIY